MLSERAVITKVVVACNTQQHMLLLRILRTIFPEFTWTTRKEIHGGYREIVLFSLTNVGTSGNVAIFTLESILYFVGGEGKFYRSKILTPSPRYVIVNSTDEKIVIRQCFTNNDHLVVPIEVEPNANVNYYWKELEVNEPQMKVASNDKIAWSTPFNTNALGETFLKLKHEDYPNRPIGLLLLVDIQETQGICILNDSKAKEATLSD